MRRRILTVHRLDRTFFSCERILLLLVRNHRHFELLLGFISEVLFNYRSVDRSFWADLRENEVIDRIVMRTHPYLFGWLSLSNEVRNKLILFVIFSEHLHNFLLVLLFLVFFELIISVFYKEILMPLSLDPDPLNCLSFLLFFSFLLMPLLKSYLLGYLSIFVSFLKLLLNLLLLLNFNIS